MLDKEELEKEVFEKVYKKQALLGKRVITIIFGIMAAIMLSIGIVLLASSPNGTENFEGGIVCTIFGAVLIVFIIIFCIALSRQQDYNKYKARQEKYKEKYGIPQSTLDLYTRLEVLERRVEELENNRQ